MTERADLSGHWVGHYSQHGVNHPISADITQAGPLLAGHMRDSDTVSEKSVFETALDAGLPPGADEQIESSLRTLFPDARGAPVRVTSRLPSDSSLEGHVRGRTVSFRKTYQGEHFVGYRVGGQQFGLTVEQHAVHYRGEVSADGASLEGRWWIDPAPAAHVVRTEGNFELRRVPG